ncbi:hypothetical protein [Robiginitalea aurantiaca]|uniref:Four helix bundle protein n=1 Tax=Robiginitalea aurantiaca TaxID=3056915 RepID=A0ABT7WBE0_9FLAO|nr:hypothetical protein [Robiginitalea aurantiaca]MDM9630223.1 hypothetical protein [Robiginitalea aurantiaca]
MSKENRDRFVRVAGPRVNKVLKALDSLEKCSNTYNYMYSEEDVDKMYGAIKSRLELLKKSFEKGLMKNNSEFKF